MKDTTTIGVISPHIQKRITELFMPIREQSLKDALLLGNKNAPAPSERVYSNASLIKSGYERGYAELLHDIKPEMHKATYEREKADIEKRKKQINGKIAELEHANQLDARKSDASIKPFKPKWYLQLFLICIYIGEAYFNSLAFEFLGGSPIGAFLLGTLATFAEAAINYKIAESLGKVEALGKKQAYTQAIVLGIVNLIIVFTMAVFRSYVISDSEQIVSPWLFFLLNIGILIATIPISQKVIPTPAQSAAIELMRERNARIKEREKEIEALQRQLKEIAIEEKKVEDDYQFIKSQVNHLAHFSRTHYRETVEMAKSENLITRNDGRTPACFQTRLADLDLIIPKL